MKKIRRVLLFLCMVMFSMAMVCGLVACDEPSGGGGGSKPSKNADQFGYERPYNCWLTDCLLLSSNERPIDMFGTGGESGLLSDYAQEQDGQRLHVVHKSGGITYTINNYLVYMIYGTSNQVSSTYLRFTLVTENEILYDEEAVEVGRIENSTYGVDATLDMSKDPEDRLELTFSEKTVQAYIVIPFMMHEEGTLYVDMRVENNAMSYGSNYYLDGHGKANVRLDNDAASVASVDVGDFTAGYLTETQYNNGDYAESDIRKQPTFDGGETEYMVLDFSYTSTSNNDGRQDLNVVVRVPESTVMDATVEEAPTGSIKEIVSGNATRIYAVYSIPHLAGETKTVRMIVRLMPLNEGLANVDIFLTGNLQVKITGNDYIHTRVVSGAPELRYELNTKKTGYLVSGTWEPSLKEIRIPNTYSGLPVVGIQKGIFKNNEKITSLYIGDNVVSLDSGAFAGCTALQTVKLGNGLTEIPAETFKNCTALSSLTTSGVTTIGTSAFEGCSSLKTIAFDSVSSVGTSAFKDCTSLTSARFGEQLATLQASVFKGCTALKTAVLSDTLTEIPAGAFSGCNALESVENVNGVMSIGGSAFSGCEKLTEMHFTSTLTEIGSSAFAKCTALTSVGDTSKVRAFPYGVFEGCALLGFVNLSSAVEIDRNAFAECTVFTHSGFSNALSWIGAYAFRNCKGLTEIVIPDSCTSIGYHAFMGTSNVKSIKLGKSVRYANDIYTNDSSTGHNDTDTHAFDCTSLESIEVSAANTKFKSVGNCLIQDGRLILGCKNSVIPESGVTEIGGSAFENCVGLTEIYLPSSIREVSFWGAFKGCTSLKKATVSILALNYEIFADCSALTELSLASNLSSIDSRALVGCTSLTTIRYAGTQQEWSKVKKGGGWDADLPSSQVICAGGVTVPIK